MLSPFVWPICIRRKENLLRTSPLGGFCSRISQNFGAAQKEKKINNTQKLIKINGDVCCDESFKCPE